MPPLTIENEFESTIRRGSLAGLRARISALQNHHFETNRDMIDAAQSIERAWSSLEITWGEGCMLDVNDRVIQFACRNRNSRLFRRPEILANAERLRSQMGETWWGRTHSIQTSPEDSLQAH